MGSALTSLSALSRSGAGAALLIGTVAIAAGWAWGALLVIYFVSSSLLSRVGARVKSQRSGSIVEKMGARDATQVFANGAVFAIAAALQLLEPSVLWLAAGAGAAFRHGGLCNYQVQLSRSRLELPLTRDYIAEAERTLRGQSRAG